MKDTRTPFLSEGIKVIQDAGFTPVIRNAGGLGIVSDQGILNISLIFPQEDENKISIDEGYEQMLALTRQAFPVYADKIEAYEIKDSYCPGTYDLSINGKKFAGIAQRRIKKRDLCDDVSEREWGSRKTRRTDATVLSTSIERTIRYKRLSCGGTYKHGDTRKVIRYTVDRCSSKRFIYPSVHYILSNKYFYGV